MASLVENSSDGIFMTDRDGTVIYANDALVQLLGYTNRAAVKDRAVFEIAPAEERDRIRHAFKHTVHDGHWEGEIQVHHSVSGNKVELQTHCFTIRRESDGEIEAIGAVVRDMGERHRAENAMRESEEHFRRLAELSQDAIVLHQDGIIIYTNSTAARMLRAKPEKPLVGRIALEMVHPDYRALAVKRIRQMGELDIKAPPMEEIFLRDDGTEFKVEVSAEPVAYGGRRCIQVICHEIPERCAE